MGEYLTRWRGICHALNIKPYDWQTAYALCGTCERWPRERHSGRTTAVILHALMINPSYASDLVKLFLADIDAGPGTNHLKKFLWLYDQYKECADKCRAAGIEVYDIRKHSVQHVVSEMQRYRAAIQRSIEEGYRDVPRP